mgnify:CR=1 FL=1
MGRMSDTTLHDLCKGFGALLSRSKVCVVCVVYMCTFVLVFIVMCYIYG